MKKADADAMNDLHGLVAAELARVIREGITVIDDNGVAHQVPAPASYIAQAVKFLKDNGIQSSLTTGDLNGLKEQLDRLNSLPFEGEIPNEYKQ